MSDTSDTQPPITKMQAVETTTTFRSVTRPRLRLAVVAGLGLVLASCARDAPQDTWQPAGPNSQMIHNLDNWVYSIAAVVG